VANETVTLDTDVLVHATFSDLPHHDAVWEELKRGRRGEVQLCVSVQSLAEFFWIVTDRRKIATPDSPELARQKVEEFLGAHFLRKLPVQPSSLVKMVELGQKYESGGPRVLNLLLVATMLDNGVETLHTLHPEDYAGFSEIEAANPFA